MIQPGGFENLFYALASGNFTPSTYSPYAISDADAYDAVSSSPPASVIASLESFDVYAQLAYAPSRDLVNGSYSSSGIATGWHDGHTADDLGADEYTPYFVGKDMGPKYLSRAADFYQIVQPLVTPTQSAGNFTMSTIIIAQKLDGESAMRISGNSSLCSNSTDPLTGHSAFEVLEGLLNFRMVGETIEMVTGDVVFVPAGTAFQYYSEVPFTKVLYISQGANGLDTRLINDGESGWEYPVWPAS